MNFSDFNFNDSILESIQSIGFEKPTEIQELAIPVILSGKDLIASAQTGTGKTAAFLLPVLQKLSEPGNIPDESIKAMVIVPTRELAVQIDQQLEGFSYFTPISSIAVYGGTDGSAFAQEKIALSKARCGNRNSRQDDCSYEYGLC